MYLSRIKLKAADRQVQAMLRDPYKQHQAMLMAFRRFEGEEAGRVLFRIEPEIEAGLVTILVQSPHAPDWEQAEMPGLLESEFMEMSPAFIKAERLLYFRLRANPTIRLKIDGKRHPVLHEDELFEWLAGKFSKGGAELLEAALTKEGASIGGASRKTPDNAKTLHSVRFDGLLRIKNVEYFASMLEAGIGSAKGFGFGLLSLAPA